MPNHSPEAIETQIIDAIEYVIEDDGPTHSELRLAYIKVREYIDDQIVELDTADLGSRVSEQVQTV